MEEKLFFTNSRGQNLCGILEKVNESKEIVIIVHGFSSHKDTSTSKGLSKELHKRNVNSFRIDLTGCGESEGEFSKQTISSAVDDVLAAIAYMRKQGFRKINLFGNSMGGITVLLAALKDKQIKSLGLKSPVSNYPKQKEIIKGEKWIEQWKSRSFIIFESIYLGDIKLPYSFFEDSMQYPMPKLVKDLTCPVLIVHGDQDTRVPVELSQELANALNDCTLVILEGADHGLAINGDRSKGNELFAKWFERGLKS